MKGRGGGRREGRVGVTWDRRDGKKEEISRKGLPQKERYICERDGRLSAREWTRRGRERE